MENCDKTFRDAIRIQLENNGVTQETCNKIDGLIVSDLSTGVGELPDPIYKREQIYATKVVEHCYKKASSTFDGKPYHQVMVIPNLPVDPMKGNWYAIAIRGRDFASEQRAWLYHNRQNFTNQQLKSMIMNGDVDALPTITNLDLIRIDGEGYPLEVIQLEPFFGYTLSHGRRIASVGRYRLPKHLETKIINEKII